LKLSDYLDSYKGLMQERKFSRAVTLAMVFTTMVLSVGLMQKKPVVVLVPPQLSEEGEISASNASSSIKKAWALTAANLVGNVSPGNVDFVESALEGILAPRLYHSLLESIHAQARSIREGNITLSFTATDVYYQKSSGLVFVTGTMSRSSRFGEPETYKRTFEFLVDVKNYRPQIAEWNAYDGNPDLRRSEREDDAPEDKLSEEQMFFDRAGVSPDKSKRRSRTGISESDEPESQKNAVKGSEKAMDDKIKEIF